MNIHRITFECYDKNSLNKSWEWLNDSEIKYLTNTADFDRKAQKKWFSDLKSNPNYYINTVFCDDVMIGVVGLKNITSSDGEYWGYIGEKEYWGKSIGVKMIDHIIITARMKNLQSVYLKVLKDNIRALKLYEKYGFKFEKHLNDKEMFMRLYLT